MNSVEFRTRLGADPFDSLLKQALQEPPYSGAEMALKRAQAFDLRLREILAEPEVPAALAERLANIADQSDSKRSRRGLFLSLAATIAIGVIGAAVWRAGPPSGSSAFTTAAIEHLSHEPFALSRQSQVPEPLVDRLFAEAGVTLANQPGRLNYLMRCVVDGQKTVHFVTQRGHGPVTGLFFPVVAQPERSDRHEQGLSVRVLPWQSGAIVLLAETDQDFDAVEMDWRRAELGGAQVAAGSH